MLDLFRIAADRTYLRTSIYRGHVGSRFDCTTKGHGWVIESKPSAIGIEEDVRRVIRERRLQEAAEEIRRNSNSDQQGTSIPRSSHLHSARSSMPSLSQYGDAESYQIGEPEETAEWYEHDETGNQTHSRILVSKNHQNP